MTVTTAARGNRKSRHDDVRAKLADDADHVGEHLLPIPEAQRLFRRLGKPKINRPSKELPATIKPAPGQKYTVPIFVANMLQKADATLTALPRPRRSRSRARTWNVWCVTSRRSASASGSPATRAR